MYKTNIKVRRVAWFEDIMSVLTKQMSCLAMKSCIIQSVLVSWVVCNAHSCEACDSSIFRTPQLFNEPHTLHLMSFLVSSIYIILYSCTYQTHYIIRALIPSMSEQFLSSWQELWKPCKHSSQPLPPKFSSVLVMKWSDWKPCLKCLSYVGSPLIANIDGATLLQCSSLPKIRIPKANGHNANGFNGCVCMLQKQQPALPDPNCS